VPLQYLTLYTDPSTAESAMRMHCTEVLCPRLASASLMPDQTHELFFVAHLLQEQLALVSPPRGA